MLPRLRRDAAEVHERRRDGVVATRKLRVVAQEPVLGGMPRPLGPGYIAP